MQQQVLLRFTNSTQAFDVAINASEDGKQKTHELVALNCFGPLENKTNILTGIKKIMFNKDGSKMLCLKEDSVELFVYLENKFEKLHSHNYTESIQFLNVGFSPLGNYYMIWTKPDSLRIIKSSKEGGEVFKLIQKKTGVSTIQWTDDERFVAYAVTNEVKILEVSNNFESKVRVHIDNVSRFSIHPSFFSPNEELFIASFIPGKHQSRFVLFL